MVRNFSLVLSLVAAFGSCVDQTPRPAGPDPSGDEEGPAAGGAPDGFADDGDLDVADCRSPRAGCPCDAKDDAAVECHSDRPTEDEHGRMRCLVGERSCEGGVWGSCVFTSSYDVSPSRQRAFADAPAPCVGVCDPLCWYIADDYAADPGPLNGTAVSWDGAAGGIVMSGAGGSVLSGDYAWVGLEASSEIARIRTSDGAQVGRYIVGEAGVTAYPSRTAVDTVGDAYVAGRGIDPAAGAGGHFGFDGSGLWGSLTRIAADPLRCNNAPLPTTSTDDVALPIGTDDCVLWNVRVGNAEGSHPRGIAIDRGDALAPAGRPWVGTTHNVDGGNDPGRAYHFDTDGTLIQSIPLPIHVYAAAADAQNPQRIWFSSYWTGRLVAVRVSDYGVEGPFAPPIPNCTGDPTASSRAIAVDSAGRIWRASGMGCGRYMTAYNPAPGTWCLARPPRETAGVAIRLNADGTNTVFASSDTSHRVYSFDPDRACVNTNFNTTFCDDWPDGALLSRYQRDYGCEGSSNDAIQIPVYPAAQIAERHLHDCGFGDCPRGFAGIDLDTSNRVIIVDAELGPPWVVLPYDPVADTWLPTWPTTGPAFPRPHALSDFTGYQRLAFTLQGSGEFYRDYGVIDPACPPATTPVWGDLDWTAITVDSRIDFYAVVTDDPATLGTAQRVYIGSTQDAAPLFVNDALPIPSRSGRYARIIAELQSLDGVTSPVLQTLRLDWNCYESE